MGTGWIDSVDRFAVLQRTFSRRANIHVAGTAKCIDGRDFVSAYIRSCIICP
jgi:hypothetical protein